MIERNKHQAGNWWNMAFGAACLLDGFFRVFSLGFLHTRFPIEVSKKQGKAVFERMKKQRELPPS